MPSLPASPGVLRIPGESAAGVDMSLPHPLPTALDETLDFVAVDEPWPLVDAPLPLPLDATEFGTASHLASAHLCLCHAMHVRTCKRDAIMQAPSLTASVVKFLKGVDLKGVESKMSSAWPSASWATMCRTCFFQAAVPCTSARDDASTLACLPAQQEA